MAIGAFPALKLFVLAAKQASKPIANVIKAHAKGHPFFCQYICMPPAQLYNWCEVKLTMWVTNLGISRPVPQLSKAAAIDLGADILGELIVFGIGAGLVFLEIARQKGNTKKQHDARLKEVEILKQTIASLDNHMKEQDEEIFSLKYALSDITGTFFDKEDF